MNNYVQEHYANKRLPGLDSILFANGDVIILDTYTVNKGGQKAVYINPRSI